MMEFDLFEKKKKKKKKLNATKPLNCILFVSLCCKFCFIPKQPFVIFTEHTMKAAWLEWGAVHKVLET